MWPFNQKELDQEKIEREKERIKSGHQYDSGKVADKLINNTKSIITEKKRGFCHG